MVIDILIFLFSILLIIFGARFFVNSSVKIARKLKVSEFVIGLTLISLGTSLPELFSSIIASVRHHSDLIAGIILGGNIADITMVVGVAALISAIRLKKQVLKIDIYMMISIILLLGIFLIDKTLSRTEGIVFVIIYLIYNFYIFKVKKKENNHKAIIKHISKEEEKSDRIKKLGFLDIILFVLGGLMLYLGAEGLVREAVLIAENLGVSIVIIGVIISIGTIIPELSVSITSSSERKGEIAVGNSVGSVITNILLILGVSAIIFPMTVAQKSISFLFLFLLGASVLLGVLIRTKWKITRIEGAVLFTVYVAFWFLAWHLIK